MTLKSYIKDGVRRKPGGSRYNYVCVSCRRSNKSPSGQSECSECHGPVFSIGYRRKPPTKSDDGGWKEIEKICNAIIKRNYESEKRYILRSVKDEN